MRATWIFEVASVHLYRRSTLPGRYWCLRSESSEARGGERLSREKEMVNCLAMGVDETGLEARHAARNRGCSKAAWLP